MSKGQPSPASSKGAILLFVLVWMAFLAALAMFRLSQIEEQWRLGEAISEPWEVPLQLLSARDVALASLVRWEREQGPRRSVLEEWGQPYPYLQLLEPPSWEGNEVELELRDLSGRIPFLLLEEEDLEWIFENSGFDRRTTQRFLDRLLDWMDEDDLRRPEGAEHREYGFESSDPLRLPPNRRIADAWEWEFFLTHAFPEGMEEGFEEWVRRLFHFQPLGGVNINAASREVLSLLTGQGGAGVESIIATRERIGLGGAASPIEDAAAYVGLRGGEGAMALVSEARVFEVMATLTVGPRRYVRRWVVLAEAPAATPGLARRGYSRHPSGLWIRER